MAAKLQTLTKLARLARFERATAWFVARYSIQLSYRRVRGATIRREAVEVKGLGAWRHSKTAPPAASSGLKKTAPEGG